MASKTRILVALSAGLVLAGCGSAPTTLSAQDAQLLAMDAELGVNDSPRVELTVPKRPMVSPHDWQGNNSARLSVGPTSNVALLKDLIRNAKKTLYIEVFNFANDSFGQQITPLVCEAADRGVKVFFLADYVGSRFSGGKTLGDQMAEHGVEFRFWSPRFIRQDDQRRGINITHRKVYLADGYRGVTGGVNLHAPFDTTTHDVLVDFRGDEAQQLHWEFNRDWKGAGGSNLSWAPLPAGVSYGTVQARTLVTSPPEGRFEARRAIYEAIEGARSEVCVEQQYLWDQGLMDRLIAAAKRGVAVRTIVPGKSDSFRALHATSLNSLIQAGGQCRLYRGEPETAHVHTKFFMIDGRWAIFGSVNGDTRALMDNQELDVATTDPGLLADFRSRLFEYDWAHATTTFHFEDSPFFNGPFSKLWEIIKYYT